jgi:hypothetical protein
LLLLLLLLLLLPPLLLLLVAQVSATFTNRERLLVAAVFRLCPPFWSDLAGSDRRQCPRPTERLVVVAAVLVVVVAAAVVVVVR